jgi:hypothetical protein
MTCARCSGEFPAEELKPVSPWVKIPASAALAFMHGGMWVFEELSKPYCAKCRRAVTTLAVGAAAVILAVAAGGVAVWLSRPSRGGFGIR